jgi:chitinase
MKERELSNTTVYIVHLGVGGWIYESEPSNVTDHLNHRHPNLRDRSITREGQKSLLILWHRIVFVITYLLYRINKLTQQQQQQQNKHTMVWLGGPRSFRGSSTTTCCFPCMYLFLMLVTRTTLGLENQTDRMVAYVANWQSCIIDTKQIEQYTHVTIAFAVSYTWTATQNICSETCEIDDPLLCNNAFDASYMDALHAQGKKVLLSFGGAGMGGSWETDLTLGCWQYCFGRETQVVQRLVDIVETYQFDGIDIDYEWYYENDQRGSGFTKGDEAIQFLSQVTLGLRQQLPPDAIVTHAPMDIDLLPGTQYFELIRTTIGPMLDFLMPQYYNGVTRPALDGFFNGTGTDYMKTATHYQTLVQDLFNGDATRILFGFCIRECGDYNALPLEAAQVMCDVRSLYPDNGGAFFWVAGDDVDGTWSSVVNQAMQGDGTSCTIQTYIPGPAETTAPTIAKTNIICGENTFEPCCPPDFTGMRASDACTKFYHCVDGELSGNPSPCGNGLLFNDATQTCDYEANVPCFVPPVTNSTASPTRPSPTPQPSEAPSTKIPSSPIESNNTTKSPQGQEEPDRPSPTTPPTEDPSTKIPSPTIESNNPTRPSQQQEEPEQPTATPSSPSPSTGYFFASDFFWISLILCGVALLN